ncbi:protein CUSTOS [Chelmon rostratus]|uniref:protein CUSTOS n=1 Tax=Chelmon rostratus TaxID=109905 RepID=UPI001BEC212E|nr:protein CUSTOS [Chelmon rostratus]
MAARAEATVRVDEDSSSSDDEALKRCQEAVWETRGDERKRGDTGVQQTKRVVVADHEHDGNELQVTEGFRTHVAKKLGSLLDRCITEIQTETSSCASEKCDDDEGFLLFSTSVPGQTADDPPAPARRRPVPSSSDSDSEMETRLKEAAVSVKDLLPSLSLSAPSAEPPCSDKVKEEKKAAEEEESVVKKRKKKRRKQSEGERDSAGSLNAQSNGEHRSSEQEHMLTKKKKKKKKKQQQDGNTEEEALN